MGSGPWDIAGGLINGFVTWYGMEKQAEENKKAREQNEQMFQTQLGVEKGEFTQKMGLAVKTEKREQKQSEFEMSLAQKKYDTEQADKQFNRQTQFLTGFTGMLNSGPQIRQSLIDTWRV